MTADKKPIIAYDHSFMLDSAIGPSGIPAAELPALFEKLEGVRRTLLGQKRAGKVGFFRVPEMKAELREAEKLAAAVRREFKTLVVIGIGGSDLGARTLVKALAPAKGGMEIRFIGGNTDPEEIAGLLRSVDWRRAAVNIVSKSGDTIEPMSAFLLVRKELIAAVGKKRHARHVIATTDAEKGTLRRIAEAEGYRTLSVPRDIGGRFSALTSVGLFPAACAGIPVSKLVAGAGRVMADLEKLPAEKNPALLLAGFHHYAYASRDRRVTVIMPYCERLREFAFWFRQLWAESLGKKTDRSGHPVHHGLTPIAALGATDQHSQLQLYQDGPDDKALIFIEVAKFGADQSVPKPYPEIEGVAYMAGHRMSEIIHVERQATALALAADGRPSGTLTIPSVSPEALGGLMFFFQIATTAMSELLGVDPYDQPGVEAGKRAIYALLGRRGYQLDAGPRRLLGKK